jgi:hypothetical protein
MLVSGGADTGAVFFGVKLHAVQKWVVKIFKMEYINFTMYVQLAPGSRCVRPAPGIHYAAGGFYG